MSKNETLELSKCDVCLLEEILKESMKNFKKKVNDPSSVLLVNKIDSWLYKIVGSSKLLIKVE